MVRTDALPLDSATWRLLVNLTRALSVERWGRTPEWSRFEKEWEERKKVETEKICLSLSSAANEEQRNKAVTGKSGGCK